MVMSVEHATFEDACLLELMTPDSIIVITKRLIGLICLQIFHLSSSRSDSSRTIIIRRSPWRMRTDANNYRRYAWMSV